MLLKAAGAPAGRAAGPAVYIQPRNSQGGRPGKAKHRSAWTRDGLCPGQQGGLGLACTQGASEVGRAPCSQGARAPERQLPGLGPSIHQAGGLGSSSLSDLSFSCWFLACFSCRYFNPGEGKPCKKGRLAPLGRSVTGPRVPHLAPMAHTDTRDQPSCTRDPGTAGPSTLAGKENVHKHSKL